MIGAKAPAKINLFFEVGPKRADGYHSVISIYQSLELFEEVYVEPAPSWSVSVSGNLSQQQLDLVPLDQTNLVVKAALALASHVGIENPQPMHFNILKQVPSAGGVAGGSADAAAALVALNEAWCLGLSRSELAQVAAKIGADIPFALLGGTALGVDSGIELASLPAADNRHVLLVFSSPGLSTGRVFEAFDDLYPEGDITKSPGEFLAGFDLADAGKNSLLDAALVLRPDLRGLIDAVPNSAKLSGSGPTLYLLSESLDELSDWQSKYADLGLESLITRFGNSGAELI